MTDRSEVARQPAEATVTIPAERYRNLISSEIEREEAMRALEGLTVGGSEFVGDVPRCVEYVRKKQEVLQDIAKNAVKSRQAAEQRVGELSEALPEMLEVIESCLASLQMESECYGCTVDPCTQCRAKAVIRKYESALSPKAREAAPGKEKTNV